MLPVWLRSFVKWVNVGPSSRRRRKLAVGRRRGYRPVLEQFEARLVPTTLTLPTNLVAGRNTVVSVPISVDTLNDAAAGKSGLTGADFAVFYDQTEFTVSSADLILGTLSTGGSTANGKGYSPAATNGWAIQSNVAIAGQVSIGLSTTNGIITSAASGTLVIINFHVKSGAATGVSKIDLAQDTFTSTPVTHLSAQDFTDYVLNPTPVDNVTSLTPYVYTGTDPSDGAITVTGVNLAPVANNDAYSITERAVQSDPGLTVPSPGVLANDSDPQGNGLTASLLTTPAHGQVTFNTDGSFVYAPTTGYLGADSFTYQASNGTAINATATVNLTVTARLSIPTNLVGSPGGTVVVPVNMDNPNPPGGLGGLTGAALAVNYDPAVFTVTGITTGVLTSATNAVQTITFGGTVTGGTFTLLFNNGSINGTTAQITYRATVATLQSNIQNALNGLMGAGNTLVSATSATSVTVAFQNALGGDTQPDLTTNSNLTGTNASVAVQTQTEGFAGWVLATNPNTTTGQIGISLSSAVSNTNTVGGSLVLITFQVNVNAPAGPSPINLVGANSPNGIVVTTHLDAPGGTITLRPVPTNASNDNGVDGVVTIASPHYAIVVPGSATAGTPFSFTVTALNADNSTNTGYTGTVNFTATGSSVFTPASYQFLAGDSGIHVFTNGVRLNTTGLQTITATDSVATNQTSTSSPITVSASAITHFAVSAPASTTAGSAFTFTVTALDSLNNTVAGYLGAVQFTKTDSGSGSAVPANYTFIAGDSGTHVFTNGAMLVTAGAQTITAADTVTTSIAGSAAVNVNAGQATHFKISAPANAVAGSAFSFTVTAQDAFANTATGYASTVAFTSTSNGSGTNLPGNSTLTAGVGTFSATLTSSGAQTLTATDVGSASITGSASINVSGFATHFLVSAPVSTTAGTPITYTVTALDSSNATAFGYAGSVHFSSSDGGAALPGDSTLVNGVGTFSATLKLAGNQTITATDTTTSSITGLAAVSVLAAQTTHFAVSAPASAAAGAPFNFTVTALDAFSNTAAFAGTVVFGSNDSQATLPGESTLTNGVGTFSATLATAGNKSITATAKGAAGITGNATVSVTAGQATHLGVSAPAGAVLGTAFNFTVAAKDAFGNTDPSFANVVQFTSSDANASLPINSSLTNGVGTFSATLNTSGLQTLTASDTANASIKGSAALNVSASATHFLVTAPATVIAGTPFNLTVTALDASNNLAASYTGIVHFTSSDGTAALPVNATLTAGVGTFSATLKTSGNQSITATDTVTTSINGSAFFNVLSGQATHFSITAPATSVAGSTFDVTVRALDSFNNTATGYLGTVHFTKSDAGVNAIVPADYAFVVADAGTHVFTGGATFVTAGTQTLTATDTVTSSITGNSAVSVSAAQAAKLVITAPANAAAGTPFTITVTAKDTFGNTATDYVGAVTFTTSDPSVNVVLPTNYRFKDSTDSGVHVFTNGVTLVTPGTQTVTVADTADSTITTGNAAILVAPAQATHFTVTAPATAMGGTAFTFTVRALDSSNNTATGYLGTVHFTKSDTGTGSVVPADYSFVGGDSGMHVFTNGATLVTAGAQTITATDTATNSITGSASVSVSIITIGNISRSRWTAGQSGFDGTLAISGGTAPFTITSSSGLPTGLTPVVNGSTISFTGTPTTAQDFPNGTVNIQDSLGVTATKTFDINIASAPTLGALSQTQWTVNQPGFSATIAISNGTSPYSNLNVTGLPTGLTAALNGSTITISGTPTTEGTFSNISVSVTDTAGAVATQTYSMVINSVVGISPSTLPNGKKGVPYSQTVTATGGTSDKTVTYAVTGTLAPGLTITPASPATNAITISGTPTGGGTATITINATDSTGASTTQVLTLTTTAGLDPNRPRWVP